MNENQQIAPDTTNRPITLTYKTTRRENRHFLRDFALSAHFRQSSLRPYTSHIRERPAPLRALRGELRRHFEFWVPPLQTAAAAEAISAVADHVEEAAEESQGSSPLSGPVVSTLRLYLKYTRVLPEE